MSSSPANPADPYLKTKVMTASSAQLRQMLFDGAIKFAQQAKSGLADDNHEAAYEGISRCQQILIELITSLRPEIAPELCSNLSSLYTFLYTRLIDASRKRDPAIVGEVIDLLQYERETWSLLLERLAQENAAAGGLANIPDAAPPETRPQRPTGLIGATVSVKG